MTVSTLIGGVVIMLFQTGLFQIRRSGGRIDLVRRARLCMDSTQRYLSGAVRPNEAATSQAFIDPDATTPGLDFSDDVNDRPFSFVRFYTANDYLGGAPLATARQLQLAPVPAYYVYELAEVPGVNGAGNDVMLRRYLFNNPYTPDTSVDPRMIARDLGVRDEGQENYRDGFVARLISPSAVQLQVAATGSRIHGELERRAVESSALMTVRLTTIVQLPYYSNN